MIERCDLVNCELRSDSGPEAGNHASLRPKFRARRGRRARARDFSGPSQGHWQPEAEAARQWH